MIYKKITVIGLGYIGLPTAAMFASKNINVLGVDINDRVVSSVNRGEVHFIEPDLDKLVKNVVKKRFLRAENYPEKSDVFLIAVPTPFKKDDLHIPEPDMSYIYNAVKSITKLLSKGNLIVLESTSPVGATEKIREIISKARPDLNLTTEEDSKPDINIAYCPERVLPGNIINELAENDRIIGGLTNECSRRASMLYKNFVAGECFVTNSRTAEMAKLTENSSRDVQIAFANELSIICDKLNINVWDLINLANKHPRVNILRPGPGVGGHCIAVDPWFIVSKNPEDAQLIKKARTINNKKPKWVVDKLKIKVTEFLQENPNKNIKNLSIACYGLSFKPNIDDLRESPSLEIAQKISSIFKNQVVCIEPNIKHKDYELGIKLIEFENTIIEADIHIFLVAHSQFIKMDRPKGIVMDIAGIYS